MSNPVYNKIRNFSIKEGKRKNRLADKEDRAVAEQAGNCNMLQPVCPAGMRNRVVCSGGQHQAIGRWGVG